RKTRLPILRFRKCRVPPTCEARPWRPGSPRPRRSTPSFRTAGLPRSFWDRDGIFSSVFLCRSLLYLYFTGQYFSVIFIILFQKFRGIQIVGTFFHTLPAAQTSLDLLHFRLHFRRQPCLRRRPAQHQRHSGAGIDLDIRGTRHTVPAAPAEFSCQFLLFSGNKGRDLTVHLRLMLHVAQPFFQFRFFLYPPYGKNLFELGHKGHGGLGTVDQASRQSFHGNETHIRLPAAFHKFFLPLGRKIAERILKSLVKA